MGAGGKGDIYLFWECTEIQLLRNEIRVQSERRENLSLGQGRGSDLAPLLGVL